MKRLHYSKTNNLSQLHDEILAAIPEANPERDGNGHAKAPVIHVEGLADDIWIEVADDFPEAALQSVVNAHTGLPSDPGR